MGGYECPEPLAMTAPFEVREFVDDHILDNCQGSKGKLEIKGQNSLGGAAAPVGFDMSKAEGSRG